MEGGILSVSPPNDNNSEDPSTSQQNGESPTCTHEHISNPHTVDALSQPTEPNCSDSLVAISGDTWPPPEENAQNSNKDPEHLGTDALHLEGTQIIAKGIASVLDPVMRDFDARAEGALKSQGILRSSIDRLTRELDKLLEDAPAPFITQNSTKLLVVRKRVSSLTSTLQVVQKRIDNIERMLSGQVFRASFQPTSLAPLQHVHTSSLKGIENGPSSCTGESSEPHHSDQHDELNDLDARKI